jgi:hypothetical protein
LYCLPLDTDPYKRENDLLGESLASFQSDWNAGYNNTPQVTNYKVKNIHYQSNKFTNVHHLKLFDRFMNVSSES